MRRALAAIAALILFVPLFGPAISRAHRAFMGVEAVDYYGTLWFYWFVDRQATAARSITHTDLFFYPWGKDIFRDTGANVLDALLAMPFRAVFGDILGFNLFLLTGLALSAWTFWLLAREFTDDRLAAGVGAMLFAAHPFALAELSEGRPTQGILALLPLVLLLSWRSGTRPGWRWPLLGGVVLALTGYQYWFYAAFSGIALIALGGSLVLRPRGISRGRVALHFAVLVGVSLVLVAPVAGPLLMAAGSGEATGLIASDRWSLFALPLLTQSDDSVALTSWQPLLRRAATWLSVEEGKERLQLSQSLTSWVALALVGVYLLRPGRIPRWPWLAITLTMMIVAIGPIFALPSSATYLPNPLYILLVKTVPVMQRLWWPVRAYSWLAVMGGLAAVAAFTWLGERGPRVQGAAILGVTALWLGDLWWSGFVPFPSWDGHIPAGYQCLARGPEGSVIELPYGFTQAHLYYQTAHGRPMLGGMAERSSLFEPEETRLLRDRNTWMRALLEVTDHDMPPRPWKDEDKAAVHDLGFRYLVLQNDAFSMREGLTDAGTRHEMSDVVRSTRLRRLTKQLRELVGSPFYEDARTVIFAPWGDPPSCDPATIEQEREPRVRPAFMDDLRPRSEQE